MVVTIFKKSFQKAKQNLGNLFMGATRISIKQNSRKNYGVRRKLLIWACYNIETYVAGAFLDSEICKRPMAVFIAELT